MCCIVKLACAQNGFFCFSIFTVVRVGDFFFRMFRKAWVSERQFRNIAKRNANASGSVAPTTDMLTGDEEMILEQCVPHHQAQLEEPEMQHELEIQHELEKQQLEMQHELEMQQLELEEDENLTFFKLEEVLDSGAVFELDEMDGYDDPQEFFKDWAIFYGLKRDAVEDLLKYLRKTGHFPSLPLTLRTLLGTPSQKIATKTVEPGEYYHFGLQKLAIELTQKFDLKNRFGEVVELSCTVHVDGIAFANASKLSGWTILLQVDELCEEIEPVLVGVYSGYAAPTDFDKFLEDIRVDFSTCETSGYDMDSGITIYFKLSKIVADTPAHSKCTHIKGHSGYKACPYCPQLGSRPPGSKSVQYDTTVALPLRDRDSFTRRLNPKHHHASHLDKLGELEKLTYFDCVNGFPPDQMHSGDSGVVKRIVGTILDGGDENGIKISSETVSKINQAYLEMASLKPIEFSRRARDLVENKKFLKATECRHIGLYYGIKIFKYLPSEMYQNYLKYSMAIRLLSSVEVQSSLCDLAEKMLQSFVNEFTQFYGLHLTYVVHVMLHMADFVRIYGPLYSFSAYKFENHLGVLKSDVRKKYQVIQQLFNRQEERGMVRSKKKEKLD